MQNSIHNTFHISGNGPYTKLCHDFFTKHFSFKKVLLTSSCTDALEMSAILADIKPGDEVIVPSYTFVSTANAFALRGANLIFADSEELTPSISFDSIKQLCNKRTKAVVVVHYGGVACQIDQISKFLKEEKILLIEDCAHAIDSSFNGRPLGSFGDLSCFSFHETKNISSGEGGLLVVNNPRFEERAEIIWEKGTNRTSFKRGIVSKYEWLDLGSSFLPSDIIAACLLGQLDNLSKIQNQRNRIWKEYYSKFKDVEELNANKLPFIRSGATINGHLFYLICSTKAQRDNLIYQLGLLGIDAIFHYVPLHLSPFAKKNYKIQKLVNAEKFGDRLVRLPLYYELSSEDQSYVIESVIKFFNQKESLNPHIVNFS